MAELRDCPFCGGNAHIAIHAHDGKHKKGVVIYCTACNVRMFYDDIGTAVISWNRRCEFRPMKTGRWIVQSRDFAICSECGHGIFDYKKHDYCPNPNCQSCNREAPETADADFVPDDLDGYRVVELDFWRKCKDGRPDESETVLLTVHEEETKKRKRNGMENVSPELTFVTVGNYIMHNGKAYWIYANRTMTGSRDCVCTDGWNADDGTAQIISWMPKPQADS